MRDRDRWVAVSVLVAVAVGFTAAHIFNRLSTPTKSGAPLMRAEPRALSQESVASHWREKGASPYDLDGDGVITVIDITRAGLPLEPCDNPKQGVGWTAGSRAVRADLGACWVRTWGLHGGFDAEFRPTVYRVTANTAQYAQYATEHPGSIWIVGNEPTLSGQQNQSPEEVAQHWPGLRDAILEADPTARFVFGNVLWAYRVGLSSSYKQYGRGWLEQYLEIDPDVVDEIDAWGVHLYVDLLTGIREWWNEKDPPSEREMLRRYRDEVDDVLAWAEEHGDLPVVFTEIGQLRDIGTYDTCIERYGCWDDVLGDYRLAMIEQIVPYLDSLDRVEGYAWFATTGDSCELGESWCRCCRCGLVDGGGLTSLGRAYKGEGW